MADNDLQAELDNIFGDSETNKQDERPAQEADRDGTQTAAASSAPEAAPTAQKGRPLLGSRAGAKPFAKGISKTPTVTNLPKPDATATGIPVPQPAVNATGVAVNLPAGLPHRALPGQAAPQGKLPLLLAALSLLFTLVCIFMVTNLGAKVDALQTAIEAQSRAQLDILNKQTKALNEQTETLHKNDRILQDQLLKKDSDFQKRMRMLMDTVEQVKDLIPGK